MAYALSESNAERLNALVPASIMAIVLMMVLPVPALLLDLLISLNITLSVITLVATMYITRPVEFSVYPSLLLLLTLLRLALNISSTRLILVHGHQGADAAGSVIEAFGNFVVGGQFAIGIVIFILLIAIQYVVINHGAVRISEVTARFTLDALPGKQMAIDSDLNAGLIEEGEAKRRREEVTREAEFYGAMDGAVRFTQRDAIASIIITAVNIVAGLLIGAVMHGMPLRDALETYTVLTVGDGLVTIVPSLLISVSGGVITTRAAGEGRLGVDFSRQMFLKPEPLLIASGVLGLMAAVPGLPTVPFLALGGGVGVLGWKLRQEAPQQAKALPAAQQKKPAEADSYESLLRVEPLAIEVGLGLVSMVDSEQGGSLIRRIAGVRRQLASELGFVLPAVRVTDNLSLKAREYVVLLKGAEISRFEIQTGSSLAINPGQARGQIDGARCEEPAFGLPAVWIPADQSDRARMMGYTVVDPANVVATHLTELIRAHAHELLSRQDADAYLSRVREQNPKLIEDLVPKLMPLSLVQRVLQNLLRERVSIRDALTVLEALAEGGVATKNPTLLTEFVRQSLSRTLVKPYLNDKGDLAAFLLDAQLERQIQSGVEHNEQVSRLTLSPDAVRDTLEKVKDKVGELHGPAALLCGATVRFALRQILEADLPLLAVLSHAEIPPHIQVVSLGIVK
ncbi:MAG: flagellar biosynthesis protein FlhA [Acidobacteria bacterium]|nr:flagellar biosynthesis protein FlhA [Acidobacteriota bacterium]